MTMNIYPRGRSFHKTFVIYRPIRGTYPLGEVVKPQTLYWIICCGGGNMEYTNILMQKTFYSYVMQEGQILNGILFSNTGSWISPNKQDCPFLYAITHLIVLNGI